MEAILLQTAAYSTEMAASYTRNFSAAVFFLAGLVLLVAGMRSPR